MKFAEAIHKDSGARLYLPDPEEYDHELDTSFAFALAEVDGVERVLRSDLLSMMLQFNSDLSGRANLKHDAHVFALACKIGNNLRQRDFDLSHGDTRVEMSGFNFQFNDDEPLAEDGDVIGIYDAQSEDMDVLRYAQRHLIVKVSIDNEEPLYLSKPGVNAAVVAHNYAEIRKVYPYEYPKVAIIDNFVRVDLPS